MASDHGLYIQMFSIHGLVRHQNMEPGYDAEAYITARTIQFFAPGVPQFHYVGLLAEETGTDPVASRKVEFTV
jgi:sucrose phosphorylase